ncbi:hypothetical protein SAMN02745163_03035 [Clostridium cavendishii DSM 21758]|uniref:Lipoprotein n=1 Tax=Clostridium cavendishii DSM 21758 TaxID=1121302 RepID=A0A1M6NVM1_9CLOT|nr:hypothetical protein [Clostridium cavendishii]SHJ99799.1 hypothetical protein SAMN02745163_03035 [Clostridium cavendishii DSM 21758]
MKKMLISLMLVCSIATLVGCGSTSAKETSSNKETKKEDVKKEANTKTVYNLTLTANAKIEPVKGDRTKDNVAQENGEYFANGSDVVKATDYKDIVVDVDAKNDTDKVISLSEINFGAELQDGYKLKGNISLTGNKQEDQVQSKSNGKYTLHYFVKNDTKAEKLKLTYLLIKNKDEFNNLIKDPNITKMSKEEVAEKYKDVFTSIELETDIKK